MNNRYCTKNRLPTNKSSIKRNEKKQQQTKEKFYFWLIETNKYASSTSVDVCVVANEMKHFVVKSKKRNQSVSPWGEGEKEGEGRVGGRERGVYACVRWWQQVATVTAAHTSSHPFLHVSVLLFACSRWYREVDAGTCGMNMLTLTLTDHTGPSALHSATFDPNDNSVLIAIYQKKKKSWKCFRRVNINKNKTT